MSRIPLFLSLAMFSASLSTFAQGADLTTPEPRTVDYDWMSVATWQEKHAADVAIAGQGGVDVVFVGDSITEGWEWNEGVEWKKRFEPLHAANFGIGGDTIQNLLWRLDHGDIGTLRPKLAVLLIGTNNLGRENATADDVARGVKAVVGRLLSGYPDAKILVHGIFPCDASPTAEIRGRVAAVNRQLRELDGLDGRVLFRDIGGVFLESDGSISTEIMADGLHPTPEGYRRWADILEPEVRRLIGADAK